MPARPSIEVKTVDQLMLMRQAGLVVVRTLDAVAAYARPGVTTAELDAVAAAVIADAGARPSFLGYGADDTPGEERPGFPGVVCLSIGSEVVHGIPGDRVLAGGDLLSVDCGAVVEGWHADAARSIAVGGEADSTEVQELLDVTRSALWQGIAALRPGGRVGDVTDAVEAYVREAGPYGIVTDYVGHGIGTAMHQEPDVPNTRPAGPFAGLRSRGPRLTTGMALAIEPMLTVGDPATHELEDGWTVVTDDGSLACHAEHTVALTPGGLWVLTAHDGGEKLLAAYGAPFGPLG